MPLSSYLECFENFWHSYFCLSSNLKKMFIYSDNSSALLFSLLWLPQCACWFLCGASQVPCTLLTFLLSFHRVTQIQEFPLYSLPGCSFFLLSVQIYLWILLVYSLFHFYFSILEFILVSSQVCFFFFVFTICSYINVLSFFTCSISYWPSLR